LTAFVVILVLAVRLTGPSDRSAPITSFPAGDAIEVAEAFLRDYSQGSTDVAASYLSDDTLADLGGDLDISPFPIGSMRERAYSFVVEECGVVATTPLGSVVRCAFRYEDLGGTDGSESYDIEITVDAIETSPAGSPLIVAVESPAAVYFAEVQAVCFAANDEFNAEWLEYYFPASAGAVKKLKASADMSERTLSRLAQIPVPDGVDVTEVFALMRQYPSILRRLAVAEGTVDAPRDELSAQRVDLVHRKDQIGGPQFRSCPLEVGG
jgi:hypothetical protein